MKFKVHSYLHPNCHHHVSFAKFNLKMHYPLLMNEKPGIVRLVLIELDKQYGKGNLIFCCSLFLANQNNIDNNNNNDFIYKQLFFYCLYFF